MEKNETTVIGVVAIAAAVSLIVSRRMNLRNRKVVQSRMDADRKAARKSMANIEKMVKDYQKKIA